MPYTSMDEVPPSLKGIEPPINLAQANFIAGVADEIGGDNAWPQAITRFKELYEETETGWVKKAALTKGSLDERIRVVRDAFNVEHNRPPENAQGFSEDLWIKEVFESFIIVEAPTGLFQYPYVVNDAGVSFGEPMKVELTYRLIKSNGQQMGNEIELTVPLLKADEDRRLVYGVVLVPDATDLQEDMINELEIEKAAHNWMSKGLLQYGYKWMDDGHTEELGPDIAHPVESYIAPVDFDLGKGHVKKGSWVLVTHVPDDAEWGLVKSGRRNAYSMRGFGTRVPVE